MVFPKGLLLVCVLSLVVFIEAIPTNRGLGRHHKKHNCVPAFLVNATEEVRSEFKAIVNQALDAAATAAAFDELAAKHPEIQEAYQQFKTNVETKYEALSTEAKEALKAFEEIKKNTALSKEERKQQEKAEWEKLSDETRRAIIDLIQLQGDCGELDDRSAEDNN
uniref:SXP/RAL-2 family protein Ani s 5-like cation-binding domain-containing protein n=1 Tax=Plectus sambesii TaxID=2011161 RepID=A0A914W7J9_9BILA